MAAQLTLSRMLSFIRNHFGQAVDYPGGLGGQCVDLLNMYLLEIWGLSPVRANAIDWRSEVISGFEWVENKPANEPPMGAIVVWEESVEAGTGVYGHVAIVVAADVMELLTFDQDWPYGSPCAVVAHSYVGIVGWHQPRL